MIVFEDRTEAGQLLAQAVLEKYPQLSSSRDIVVLALPRGGVPVAAEIAKKLAAPLDLIVAHKLGAPGNPEFAIGAVAEDGSSFVDIDALNWVSQDYLKQEMKQQLKEIEKRIQKYRGGKPLLSLQNKIVILVDDGIATGNTMKATIALAKAGKARKIIIAVPILPPDTLHDLKRQAEVVYLDMPSPFLAIGRFYRNFEQLTDEEVKGYIRH